MKLNNLNRLWSNGTEECWKQAYCRYEKFVTDKRKDIVKEFEKLDVELIKSMSAEEFYNFLYDKYFVWKFESTKGALEDTRRYLKKHDNKEGLEWLGVIHKNLFQFDKSNIGKGLEIARKIDGLAVAGASGLLAVLFPKHFATVDKYVVNNLKQIKDLLPQRDREDIEKIDPSNMEDNYDGVVVIRVLRDKAKQLNEQFSTEEWTPQKIDLILWSVRETNK